MSDTIGFSARLDEWQRAELGRHLEQTRHMCYGSQERIKALYFRLPFGHPETVDPSPCAAFLTELAAAAQAGGAVKVPRMSKPDRVRVSELLRQTADRPAREPGPWNDATARELAALAAAWDERYKVPSDELTRAEYVQLPRGVVVAG